MSRLRLTRSEEDYLDYLDLYMRDVHGIIANDIGDIPFSLCIPNRFPCLSSMNVSTNAANGMYMTLVICNKNQAKRLVYPQTNTNKYVTGFHLLTKGSIAEGAMKYVDQVVYAFRLSGYIREQQTNVSRLLAEAKQAERHNALITHRIFYADRHTRVADFYLVDTAHALELVHFGKKLSKLKIGKRKIRYSGVFDSKLWKDPEGEQNNA